MHTTAAKTDMTAAKTDTTPSTPTPALGLPANTRIPVQLPAETLDAARGSPDDGTLGVSHKPTRTQVLVALAMAALFSWIPWWDLLYSKAINEDLEFYLQHPEWASIRLERLLAQDWWSIVTHAPLWYVGASLVAENDLPNESLLTLANICCWFGVFLAFQAERVPPWFVFFLFNPYLIDLTVIHHRQGMATGLLLTADVLAGGGGMVVATVATLIHASGALIAGAWLFRYLVAWVKKVRPVLPLLLMAAVIVGQQIVTTIWAEQGDQRALYAETRADSGLYSVPWIICAAALLLEPRGHSQNWRQSAYVVFAVTAFALTSGGAYRMVEGAFPFLVLAAHSLTAWRRYGVLVALVVFQVIQFVYKFTYMYS